MDLGFADATAVVTGGSKGMGRAVAEVLAADGARVAVMARGRDALDETVATLRSLGSPDAVSYTHLDVYKRQLHGAVDRIGHRGRAEHGPDRDEATGERFRDGDDVRGCLLYTSRCV